MAENSGKEKRKRSVGVVRSAVSEDLFMSFWRGFSFGNFGVLGEHGRYGEETMECFESIGDEGLIYIAR